MYKNLVQALPVLLIAGFNIIPWFIAILFGLFTMGALGFLLPSLTTGLGKLALMAISIFAMFIALQRQSKEKSWDSVSVVLLIGGLFTSAWILATYDVFGLPFSAVYKSIIGP